MVVVKTNSEWGNIKNFKFCTTRWDNQKINFGNIKYWWTKITRWPWQLSQAIWDKVLGCVSRKFHSIQLYQKYNLQRFFISFCGLTSHFLHNFLWHEKKFFFSIIILLKYNYILVSFFLSCSCLVFILFYLFFLNFILFLNFT